MCDVSTDLSIAIVIALEVHHLKQVTVTPSVRCSQKTEKPDESEEVEELCRKHLSGSKAVSGNVRAAWIQHSLKY